ncbi:MAG: inositol monophosphatase [Alphaproteobacteria bacterium]|nr:inositol monophosphatase [Alphaproteobacteria bacterium]
MLKVDSDKVIEIIRETAETVILPRFCNLSECDIKSKESKDRPADLVTIADIEAEKILSEKLGSLINGSKVIGEEAAYENPAILNALADDSPVWVIDPIDGTKNFANGNERFAVIVALVCNGETIAGWIHDPVKNITATAEKGGGAWLEGARIELPPSKPINEMTGGLGHKRNQIKNHVKEIQSLGSAAHYYIELLKANLDFVFFRKQLNPWDHAAGVLMHSEAGGYSALLCGDKYQPFLTDDYLLLSSNRVTWDELSSKV